MDMENREKQSQEMKNSMQQQAGAMEGEYKQTIENLKKKSEDIIKKLTEEKVSFRDLASY
jgi:F0F1-type ATP synthase membrane subunit b/b'